MFSETSVACTWRLINEMLCWNVWNKRYWDTPICLCFDVHNNTGLVFCVVGSFGCDDLDSAACTRLATTRPNMCNDTCFASICKRYCGKCRKYHRCSVTDHSHLYEIPRNDNEFLKINLKCDKENLQYDNMFLQVHNIWVICFYSNLFQSIQLSRFIDFSIKMLHMPWYCQSTKLQYIGGMSFKWSCKISRYHGSFYW